MSVLSAFGLGFASVGSIFCLPYQLSYYNTRRKDAQDVQPLYYPSSRFHTFHFVKFDEGVNETVEKDFVVERLHKLNGIYENLEKHKIIYAGLVYKRWKIQSKKVPDETFDVAILVQHHSRESFELLNENGEYANFKENCACFYSIGFKRPPATNLALPIGLRLLKFISGSVPEYPYEEASLDEVHPDKREEFEQFLKFEEAEEPFSSMGERGVCVFNLITPGTKEQQKNDREYTLKMAKIFASYSKPHGPLHLGQAVHLEETIPDEPFTSAAIVYYPSIQYLMTLAKSKLFQSMFDQKQPGDTQALLTVPIPQSEL